MTFYGDFYMSDKLFYLCGMTPDTTGGIYGYELDENNIPQQKFHQPFCGCNLLCRSVDGKVLYSTCIIDGNGGVASFRIKADGSLEYLNMVAANGKSTCYVATAPGGKYLYAANYSSSNISEFTLNSDGSIRELKRSIMFSGSGPDERQNMPHPHFTDFTPDGRQLMVIDLGTDEIRLFDFDPEAGLLNVEKPDVFKVEPAGSGPRHIIFNRAGNMAYLLNEIGNTVCVLDFADGKFTFRQLVNTLPESVEIYSKASAIRLSADERFLFASNRGYDSTAVFKILADGTLELQDVVPSEGESPRDVNFLPGGEFFAMANEFSDNLSLFAYDKAAGKLTSCNFSLSLPRPLYIYY
ncbi:MAG: lactonase family protein [Lentisphaerae bacterium]|nr:lactonase family protein [Lentisphaerota bacterium]